MGTYDHKQVLLDYANGALTIDMAVGHSLQHVGKLYEAQTAASLKRYELRSRLDTLENLVTALQDEVLRLTIQDERTLSKRKKKSSGET